MMPEKTPTKTPTFRLLPKLAGCRNLRPVDVVLVTASVATLLLLWRIVVLLTTLVHIAVLGK